jgi:hypothetical protein
MPKHSYKPISEAPKDGTPIVGVCGGIETAVAYDDGAVIQGWFYWDEDEGGTTFQFAKPQPTEWRHMFLF